MCGEKIVGCVYLTIMMGSPPHVRGKEKEIDKCYTMIGITPACAGKRFPVLLLVCLAWDHPRMCGEKIVELVFTAEHAGSPPHVRGKGSKTMAKRTSVGITPACAGKRLKRSRSIVPHAAIVPLFPSVCNKPAGSDGSPAGHDAPPFLPIENAAPASPAYNLRSL